MRQHEIQPEQDQDHQLIVHEVRNHRIAPLPDGVGRPFYPVFKPSELSAALGYTTQQVAAVGRRVATLCKGEDGLHQQLALYHVYYNFVLPHANLRQPWAEPVRTYGTGSAQRWRPWTPAMAAGLTDHVWTLKDVLRYRVPSWPQAQLG